MPNPIYILLIFLAGIILGLFLNKSRNLTILLLLLIFLSGSILPFLGFWKAFFNHFGAASGNFFGIEISSIILDESRALLLWIINLFGFFAWLFLIDFILLQKKSNAQNPGNHATVKLIRYLLFFFFINLMILSNSLLITTISMMLSFIFIIGLFKSIMSTKEYSMRLILMSSFFVFLITALLIMIFYKNPYLFSNLPDTVNFLFISGILLLFSVFPLIDKVEKETLNQKGIFLLLYQTIFISAVFFVLYLLSQHIESKRILNAMAIMGLLTYLFSSFMASGQISAYKILNYNTSGQFGLMVSIIGLGRYFDIDNYFILVSIFLTHFFAKAGIFLLVSDLSEDKISHWSSLRKKTVFLFFFGIFIFGLAGFPPFPAFFGRWKIFTHLVNYKMYDWIIAFGIGFLLEAYYLLRWVAGISKKEKTPRTEHISMAGWLSASFTFILFILSSNFLMLYMNNVSDLRLYILAMIFLLFLLSFTPPLAQFVFSIGLLLDINLVTHLSLSDIRLIPIGIIILFAILLLIPNLRKHKHQPGLNAIILLMAWSAIIPVIATQWMTVIYWSFLFIAGTFLFMLHRNKLKGQALFFILFSFVGILTASIGLLSSITKNGNFEIAAFAWQDSLLLHKGLMITGAAIFFIAFLVLLGSALSRRPNVATGYFTFRNILAESFETLIASQLILYIFQIIITVGVFLFLVTIV